MSWSLKIMSDTGQHSQFLRCLHSNTLTDECPNIFVHKIWTNELIWKNVWINICDQYIQIYNRHTLICIYICICVAVLNLEEYDEAGDPGEKHRHAVNYSWWCRVAEISIKHGFCSSPSLPWSVQFLAHVPSPRLKTSLQKGSQADEMWHTS